MNSEVDSFITQTEVITVTVKLREAVSGLANQSGGPTIQKGGPEGVLSILVSTIILLSLCGKVYSEKNMTVN